MSGAAGIDWQGDARALFETLMEIGPPEALREAASRALGCRSEQNCRARGADRVCEEDVVRACLAVTPPVFRAAMLEDLGRLGIDVDEFVDTHARND